MQKIIRLMKLHEVVSRWKRNSLPKILSPTKFRIGRNLTSRVRRNEHQPRAEGGEGCTKAYSHRALNRSNLC